MNRVELLSLYDWRIWPRVKDMALKQQINSPDFEKRWMSCPSGRPWLLTLLDHLIFCIEYSFFEDFSSKTWWHCVVLLRSMKNSEEVSGSRADLFKNPIKSPYSLQPPSQARRGIVAACGWRQILGRMFPLKFASFFLSLRAFALGKIANRT